MKFKMLLLSALLVSTLGQAGGCLIYTPPRTDCWEYGEPPSWRCETWTLSDDGSEYVTRDMITDAAQAEEAALEAQAHHYAEQFALSQEQGMKIARTLRDFEAVKSRTDRDVADFAQRLYGVNPHQVVKAIGRAQAGDVSELDRVVAQAAGNFKTSRANMKKIIKSLHGEAMKEYRIRY